MTTPTQGRLVILSGPSCAGKSPLEKALARFHPELRNALQPIVLFNSRAARPGEMDGVDYHFRARANVEALATDDRYVVMDVRGDMQALDLHDLADMLAHGNAFFEGNPFVGRALLTHPSLDAVEKLSVFMSPVSRDEILYLRAQPGASLPDLVTDVMRRKLLRRTRKQKGELSLKDLENIEKRAGSAYTELTDAHRFAHVIANHDGEDSENWDAFYYPLGDARKALKAFVALLESAVPDEGTVPDGVERWEADLVV